MIHTRSAPGPGLAAGRQPPPHPIPPWRGTVADGGGRPPGAESRWSWRRAGRRTTAAGGHAGAEPLLQAAVRPGAVASICAAICLPAGRAADHSLKSEGLCARAKRECRPTKAGARLSPVPGELHRDCRQEAERGRRAAARACLESAKEGRPRALPPPCPRPAQTHTRRRVPGLAGSLLGRLEKRRRGPGQR